MSRLEFEGPPIATDGLLRAVQRVLDVAQGDMGVGVVFLQGERLAQIPLGSGQVARLRQLQRAVRKTAIIHRRGPDRPHLPCRARCELGEIDGPVVRRAVGYEHRRGCSPGLVDVRQEKPRVMPQRLRGERQPAAV